MKARLKSLANTGSFKSKRNRRRSVTGVNDNLITVLAYFHTFPTASVDDEVRDVGLKKSSISWILKSNGFKPFKFHLVQHLNEPDFQRRIAFCEWLLLRCQEDDRFLSNIWSDEAKFSKNGIFNRHNAHFYATENPYHMRVNNFQESWSFNCFCAIKDSQVVSLKFYDQNLDGLEITNFLS